MAFIEQRLPDCIAFGATFGPEYQTNVVVVNSGHENRNINWAKARLVANIGYRNKPEADTQALIAWFRSMKGRAHGFRVRDWSDYTVTVQTGTLKPLSANTYQLCKTYETGTLDEQRDIRKPVAAGLQVFDAGGTPLPALGYTLDTTTGVVTTQSYTPPPTSLPVLGVDTNSFRTLIECDLTETPAAVGRTVSFQNMVGAVELEGVSTTLTALSNAVSLGAYCGVDPSTFNGFVSGDLVASAGAATPITGVRLDLTTVAITATISSPVVKGDVITLAGLDGAPELEGVPLTLLDVVSAGSDMTAFARVAFPVTGSSTSGTVSLGGSPVGTCLDVSAANVPVLTAAGHEVPIGYPMPGPPPPSVEIVGVTGAVELNGSQIVVAFNADEITLMERDSLSVSPYTGGGTVQTAGFTVPITDIKKNARGAGIELQSGHGIGPANTVQLGNDFVGATELNGLTGVCRATLGATKIVVDIGTVQPSPYISGGSVIVGGGAPIPAPIPASWAGEFDVPVRFDVDKLELEVSDRSAKGLVYSWPSIPLIELRV